MSATLTTRLAAIVRQLVAYVAGVAGVTNTATLTALPTSVRTGLIVFAGAILAAEHVLAPLFSALNSLLEKITAPSTTTTAKATTVSATVETTPKTGA